MLGGGDTAEADVVSALTVYTHSVMLADLGHVTSSLWMLKPEVLFENLGWKDKVKLEICKEVKRKYLF